MRIFKVKYFRFLLLLVGLIGINSTSILANISLDEEKTITGNISDEDGLQKSMHLPLELN